MATFFVKKIFLCYDARISFYCAWVLIMAKSFLLPNAESIRKGFFQNNCCIVLYALKKSPCIILRAGKQQNVQISLSEVTNTHFTEESEGYFCKTELQGRCCDTRKCVYRERNKKWIHKREVLKESFFIDNILFVILFNIVMICLSFEWRCNKTNIALLQVNFKTFSIIMQQHF